ncbi:metal-dependent transcriptional regulator [Brevibacterium sp. LE-L]|uniref:metal-dependent transcriptional regulator n=1 Tax=Brevibacterium sp. LE-L TaxID=3418557 RepID=UPI003CED7634
MTRAQLAETLQRSRPAVTQYLRVLASHNLVRQEHYGPLSLTEAGACRALSAVRAERICRCHLFTILSVPWHGTCQPFWVTC